MLRLKKLHLRSIRGNYVRTQTVLTQDGKQQEITVCSGDNCLFIGQYTPLRTIVIHESAFSDERLLSYVITHERAHKKQSWAFLIIPLALLVIFQAPGFLVLSLTSIGQTIATHNWYHLLYFPLGIIVAAALITVPCAFSWIMELDADFQAIRTIGFQTFLNLKNNALNPSKHNFSSRAVINFMTHPPAGVTIRIWQWLHRKDKGIIYMTRA